MNQYDPNKIVIHNWPEVIQASDGQWIRNWEITFKHSCEIKDLSEMSHKLSYSGFNVKIHPLQDKSLLFCVTTIHWSQEDYLYFNTYKMFEEINDLIGEIESIQGQPRDCWDPWLRNNRHPENKYKLSRTVIEEIEVGLRTSVENGISFFGIEQINNLILEGGIVVSIEPYGAITREIKLEHVTSTKIEISGFSIIINIRKTIPNPDLA